jgi:hypothetical protein
MRFVVAAKFKCAEQVRQHAAIVVAVQSPQNGMNNVPKSRVRGLELPDEAVECL